MSPTILIIGAILVYFFYKQKNVVAKTNFIVIKNIGTTISNLLKFKPAPGNPIYGSAAFIWGRDPDGKIWYKNIDTQIKKYFDVLNKNNVATQLFQDSDGTFYFIQDGNKYTIN